MTNDIYVQRAVTTGGAAPEASLEELLTFERLLFDLSTRFANVAGEQVVAEIESALKQLLKFLGFDRGTLAEALPEEKQAILCSVHGGRGAVFAWPNTRPPELVHQRASFGTHHHHSII